MTTDQQAALDHARTLADAGVPIFCAYPDTNSELGFRLPKNWQKTTPKASYVDAWKPGMALCAVMGYGLDLVDLDPRNGGNAAQLNGCMPTVYAVAATPSDGWHGFVASLGVRSRDGVLPGIDIKAGVDGEGHGFAFLAPTERASKVTGEIVPYRWERPPEVHALQRMAGDQSGEKLAALVNAAHGSKRSSFTPPDQDDKHTGPIPDGKRHSALVSYAGRLRRLGLSRAEAEPVFRRRWEDCEQPPKARFPVTWDEAVEKLDDVYGRYESGTNQPQDGDWPELVPLGQTYPPPLPVDACGPILAPLIEQITTELQVPSDLVVNMAFSVIAAAAQGRYRVRVNPDWTEVLSLSSTSVANSGERKSPILSILTEPLIRLERELREADSHNSAWRAEQIKLQQARVEEARKEARRNKNKEWDLQAEIEELSALTPIQLPRLFADDATPEAILRLLAEQDGSIAVLSAEPGFFATLAGRYSNQVANLDGALKATSGEAVRVDRKGAEPLMVDRPCLTVGICIQPGLLEQLGRKPELRYSGFLARFLYVYPKPTVGSRVVSLLSTTHISQSINSSSSFSYIETLVRHSHTLKWLTQSTELVELNLVTQSTELLGQFQAELEPRLDPNTGDLATIADWGAKLPGTAVRIATALTLLADPRATTIEPDVMADAIRLAKAYIPHCKIVLDTIRGNRDDLAELRDVQRAVLSLGKRIFTLRDVHRKIQKTSWVREAHKPADAIADELTTLEELGHVRLIPEPDEKRSGRPPSPRYEINPAHLEET